MQFNIDVPDDLDEPFIHFINFSLAAFPERKFCKTSKKERQCLKLVQDTLDAYLCANREFNNRTEH